MKISDLIIEEWVLEALNDLSKTQFVDLDALAERSGVDADDVTKAATRLEKAGLVVRRYKYLEDGSGYGVRLYRSAEHAKNAPTERPVIERFVRELAPKRKWSCASNELIEVPSEPRYAPHIVAGLLAGIVRVKGKAIQWKRGR